MNALPGAVGSGEGTGLLGSIALREHEVHRVRESNVHERAE